MKISFDPKNQTEASIIIKIEEADYQDRVAKKIKEYSKKAQIQGFRPGKVPTAVVQQMYGQSILVDEINHLLGESVTKYLRENEINALGEPIPSQEKMAQIDWEHQKDFEFAYTIGTASAFSSELSKKIKVTHYKINGVAQKTVHDLVAQLRKTYGEVETVDKSTDQDVIQGVLHYAAQDLKAETKIAVDALAPEVRERFVGLVPEDQVIFEVNEVIQAERKLPEVPEQMHEAMLAGGGKVTLTVQKIDRTRPAVLDQPFFDKVLGEGIAQSEDEFIEKLQARLIESKQQEADSQLEQSIQVVLLEEAAIALPDELLKKGLQEKNPEVSNEEIDTYYRQHYAKELQWGLLVEKIGKEHQLEVKHEEVVEEIEQRFKTVLGGNDSSQQLADQAIKQLAQNFLQENKGKNYKQLYDNLHAQKLLAFIKEHITLLPEEVSVEAFDKIILEQPTA